MDFAPRVDGRSTRGILPTMGNEPQHARPEVSPDPYVRLAAAAIRAFIEQQTALSPPADLPAEMRERAAVFVSIKKSGALRGCIGTFFPSEPTIADEIVVNAIKSATMDPRFPPIDASEVDDLSVSVDVLTTPEPCTEADLDPSVYGILVRSGARRGLLLPDLEGVETVADQVLITRRKAGIGPNEPIEIARFRVERHT